MELELVSVAVLTAGVCGIVEDDPTEDISTGTVSCATPEATVDEGAATDAIVGEGPGQVNDGNDEECNDEPEVCNT